ncbi:MAG TPA: YceI family protein [Gemmatimonadales bacterium]|nr:YceI family protein [Gemmatimonadales bacterium]
MSSLAIPSPTATARWDIDAAHSGIHFSVRHMMIANVRGEFGRVTGSADLDPRDLSRSAVRATIDASSINTREPQRDAHLRSADFLDTANHPTIEFRSTRVERTGADRLAITGELTIRGVTREVTLAVETDGVEHRDPFGNLRRGATATTSLNRTDFGLTWNAALEVGGVLVGEEVKVTIDVQLLQAASEA